MNETAANETAIRRAVDAAGGQTALADAIGVSQGLVWQWLQGQTAIHHRHFKAIEAAAKGLVTPSDLLADEMAKSEAKKCVS
jgi:DNA-binding transcriptional regulator YdaS (Cro superfamily)